MRILGVIPARGGSKGVPAKNLRVVGGAPLVVHSIRTAQAVSDLVFRTVVSTDDPETARVAREAGGDVPFLRPAALAGDHTPMAPAVRHAVEFVEADDRKTVEWVLLLQPTNPIRLREDVEAAVRLARAGEPCSVAEGRPCDSVVSVVRVHATHPVLMKRIDGGWLRPWGTPEPRGGRRQDYDPPAYMRNGAIYLTRRDVVMGGSMWGDRVRPYEMPEEWSVGIDTELDLRLADLLMREDGAAHEDGPANEDRLANEGGAA